MKKPKCTNCRKTATFRVRNAFTSAANGQTVCDSNVCWGRVTGGYPAEGVLINPSK